MLVIMVSLCLIVTGFVAAVSVHGWWQYVLGLLLCLVFFGAAVGDKSAKWSGRG